MNIKQEKIKKILDNLFKLEGAEKLLRPKIEEFTTTVINGDTIEKDHLISTTSATKEEAFVIFVLTNRRLIKIDIREESKSTEFLLDKMNIEWMSGNYEGIRISSSTGSFSIQNIDDADKLFFKAVGEARLKIEAQNGNS